MIIQMFKFYGHCLTQSYDETLESDLYMYMIDTKLRVL